MSGATESSESRPEAWSATAGLTERLPVVDLPAAATVGVPASSRLLTAPLLESLAPTAISSANTLNTRFELKQQWEGTVAEVLEDSFVVTLKDLTDPSNPEESSELFFDDVGESDRPLLELGAIFYWSVGYEDTPRGRERKSIIRFRRLPGWSRKSLEAAKAKASELSTYFLGAAREAQSR